MIGLVEDQHVRAPGGGARNFDGVLHRLCARGEQSAALVEGSRRVGVEPAADLGESLVLGHHETRVGEAIELGGDVGLHERIRRTDAGDRDARGEVDNAVTVDILQDAAIGTFDEDRQRRTESRSDLATALLMQLPGSWPRNWMGYVTGLKQGGKIRSHEDTLITVSVQGIR